MDDSFFYIFKIRILYTIYVDKWYLNARAQKRLLISNVLLLIRRVLLQMQLA